MLKTNEYIKREVAINRIHKAANMIGFENPAVAIDCAISTLENTPAADVEPVRYGQWIEEHFQSIIPLEYDESGEVVLHDYTMHRCSLCGRHEKNKEPYCNCGAKMNIDLED